MQSSYTNYEISLSVKDIVEQKSWSYRTCAKAFNERYEREIAIGEVKAIDKDFVRRIITDDFKVQSDRVLNFCSFLEINISQKNEEIIKTSVFRKEVESIEKVVRQKPELEKTVRNLLKNIALIAKKSTLQGS